MSSSVCRHASKTWRSKVYSADIAIPVKRKHKKLSVTLSDFQQPSGGRVFLSANTGKIFFIVLDKNNFRKDFLFQNKLKRTLTNSISTL